MPQSITNQLSANVFNYTLVYADGSECSLYRSLFFYKRGRNLVQGPWADVHKSILQAVRIGGPLATTRIELAREISLVRVIKIPANARSDVSDIARLDLEHNTPFQIQSVYIGHVISSDAEGDLRIYQYVVRKSRIEGVLQGLRKCGVNIEEIAIIDKTQRIRLDISGNLSSALGFTRYLLFLAAALVTSSLFFFIWQANADILVQEKKIETIAAQIKLRKASVEHALSKQRSKTAAFDLAQSALRMKRSKASALFVLNEVSRYLPNNAWVKDFRLQGKALTLTGYASQPQSMIAELSKSSIFKNVRFISALTRAQGTSMEQFQLQIEVVGLDGELNQ